MNFDLHFMIEEFADAVAPEAHEKGLAFASLVAPDVPSFLCGDPSHLRQKLLTIVGNAIKCTSQGEVVLFVNAVSNSDINVDLHFAVLDTGSEINKGSEFCFTASFLIPNEPPPQELIDSHLQGKRILVVEQHLATLEVLKNLLRSWELSVFIATDLRTVQQMLEHAQRTNQHFAATIINTKMPGIEDGSLASVFKSDIRLQKIPHILLVALGQQNEKSSNSLEGVTVLTKPVKKKELYEALFLAMKGRKPAALPVPSSGKLALPACLHHARILIAEDNLTNQKVAVTILAKLGLRAEVVANGKEVIQALAIIPYDLVLMDLQMPEMDGLQTTKMIRDFRTDVLNHQIPIIAVTALARRGDRENCFEAGMDDYLAKPIDVALLVATLQKWLIPKNESFVNISKVSQVSVSKRSEKIPIFDRSELLMRVLEDTEFADEVLKLFMDDIPTQIALLGNLVEQRDLAKIEKQAHKIAGAASTIAAGALNAVATEIEQACRAGEEKALPNLLLEIHLQLDTLKAFLKLASP